MWTRPIHSTLFPSVQILLAFSNLIHHEDWEMVSDTCWTLSYLRLSLMQVWSRDQCSCSAPLRSAVWFWVCVCECVFVGVCSVCVSYYSLRSSPSSPQTPALRAVGNVVTGSDHQTQLVLDCGTSTTSSDTPDLTYRRY